MAKKTSIPWLRQRTQRSGHDCYYLEIPNSNPRKEVSLGSSREGALHQRQIWLEIYWSEHPLSKDPLVNLLLQYQSIHVPLLDSHAKKENHSSLRNLVRFFSIHNFMVEEYESSLVVQKYLMWRNPKLAMRAKSELSLVKRVVKVSQSWRA